MLPFFKKQISCLVDIEACVTLLHWARQLVELGEKVEAKIKIFAFNAGLHMLPTDILVNISSDNSGLGRLNKRKFLIGIRLRILLKITLARK